MEIKWKNIDYRYECSNAGDIRNMETGLILACTPCNSGYRTFCANIGGLGYKTFSVHRIVGSLFLNLPIDDPLLEIDHITGDKLDNRTSNLRIVDRVQQMRGYLSPKAFRKDGISYRGVYRSGKKFIAKVGHKGGLINCGTHRTQVDAAIARDRMAYGLGFAKEGLNFPGVASYA